MPDESTVTQNFDLLREPLSSFAKQLEKSTKAISSLNKNLTNLSKLDWSKIEDTLNQVNNTTDPAPLQSIPVKKGTSNTSPISTAVGPASEPTNQPSKQESNKTTDNKPPVQNNTTNNTYTGYGAFGRAAPPPDTKKSFFSASLEKINKTFQNTVKDIKQGYQQGVSGKANNSETINNVDQSKKSGDTFLTTIMSGIKERTKQLVADTKEGFRSGRTGTENQSSGSMISNTANILGDVWKDQRDNETPLTKMVDSFKAFKSGQFKSGFKGIGDTVTSAQKISTEETKKRQENDKQSVVTKAFEEQQKLIEQGFTPTEAAKKIQETGKHINEGVDQLKQSTEPAFPVPNSPHASEYVKAASDNINEGVLKLKEQSESFTTNLIEFPTLIRSSNITSETSKPVEPTKTTPDESGIRQSKQTGPMQVEITNFDELTKSIADLLEDRSYGNKNSFTTGDQSAGDDSSIFDTLGGLFGASSMFGGSNKKDKTKNKTKNKTKTKSNTKPTKGGKPGLFKRMGGKFKSLGKFIPGVGKVAKLAGGAVAGGMIANKLKSDTPDVEKANKKTKPTKTPTKTTPIADSIDKTPGKTSKPTAAAPKPTAAAPKPTAAAPEPKPVQTKQPDPTSKPKPAPKPAPKPPAAKKGFFASMWDKTKSVGKKAMTKAKGAISTVKKGVKALSPSKLISSAKKAISSSAGKILPKLLKVPVIGPLVEGVFATMEAKDVLANQELTAKDKQKHVGAIVGRSVGGVMGGAIAGLGSSIFGPAAPFVAPIAYLGGDYLGRMGADALMNNVPDIDTKLGQATGNVFGIDYDKNSKVEQPEADEIKPVTTSKPEQQPEGEDNVESLIKPVDPDMSSVVAIPDNKVDIPASALASSATSTLQAIPGKQIATKTTPTVSTPKLQKGNKNVTPPGAKSIIGKAAIGATAGVAGVAAAQSMVGDKKQYTPAAENSKTVTTVDKPTTEDKQYTPAAENSATITKPAAAEPQPVAVQHNEQLQKIIETFTQEKTQTETASDPSAEQPNQITTSSSKPTTGIIAKTKKIASDVYPQSILGKSVTGVSNLTNKVVNKTADWKNMSARERYFDRMKNLTGKGVQATKTGLTTTTNSAKTLFSKGSTMAKQSSIKLKEKLGETIGNKPSPIGKAKPGFMSSLDNLISLLPIPNSSQTNKPLPTTGSLFKKSVPNNSQPIGKPTSKIQSLLGSLGSNTKQIIPSLLASAKNIPKSLSSFKQNIIQNRQNRGKSTAIQTSNNIKNTSPTVVQNKPTIQNRLKETVSSTTEKTKNILSNTVPLGERMKSSALSGATRMKQFAKSQFEPTNNTRNNNTDSNKASSNTVISNSTNSTNTTTINRYDTDVVSKWRNSYIDNQHKPGNYS